MPNPSMIIEFTGMDKFFSYFGTEKTKITSVPDWTKLNHMPCPGNIEHGPNIDYCRLGIEIETLIKYFSDIKSIENGTLTIHHDERIETRINSDAQTIFYNSLWFTLLHSNCSLFKYNQWPRSNYIPSTDPDRLFYILFSIFLTESFAVTPDKLPDIDRFKSEMIMLRNVLNNLLDRIKKGTVFGSDSVINGIVLFSNLVLILNLNFEKLCTDLKENINNN